eukprot:TRINITY_DN26960_c0_g1_i1.p1 TRINITY_DN26960_c0_g1~~TRINITY_DN26960_c0_g1_i1.p1  ORF type:complete len:650 (+),score=217.82 TRINITY_DN26960_c0_g1_i1:145-1950(+)
MPDSESIPWRVNYNLGDGIMNDGSVGPAAFELYEDFELPDSGKAPHGKPAVTVALVTDSDSYSDLIDMSIEASAQYNGGFVSGGGGAEASFLSNTCSSSASVHLTVNSSWIGDARTFKEGTKLRLTEKAKEKLVNEGPTAFERAYGRYYVHGCKSGAWYHAVTSFKAKDSSHKEDIKAALNLNFSAPMVSGDMKVKVGMAVEKAAKNTSSSTTEAASGWSGNIPFSGAAVLSNAAADAPKAKVGETADATAAAASATDAAGAVLHFIERANTLVNTTKGSLILAILKPYSAVADYMEALAGMKVLDLGKTARDELRRELINLDYLDKAIADLLDDTTVPDGAKAEALELKKPIVAARVSLESINWGDYSSLSSFNAWLSSGRVTDDRIWQSLFVADGIAEQWSGLAARVLDGKAGKTKVFGNLGPWQFDDGPHEYLKSIQINVTALGVHGLALTYVDGAHETRVQHGYVYTTMVNGTIDIAMRDYQALPASGPGDLPRGAGITGLTIWSDDVVRNVSYTTTAGSVDGPVALVPKTTMDKATRAVVELPEGAVVCGVAGSLRAVKLAANDVGIEVIRMSEFATLESLTFYYRRPWASSAAAP